MTEQDKRAVAHAVAKTFASLRKGETRQGYDLMSKENVGALLYYHINPWCTDASFNMLERICEGLEGCCE